MSSESVLSAGLIDAISISPSTGLSFEFASSLMIGRGSMNAQSVTPGVYS